ncbi:MAG: tandem-95 repeat protein, partial [Myxococcota bacterium]
EGSGSAPFSSASVSDADSADFDGGTLTFSIASGSDGSETLYLAGLGGVTTSGSNAYVGGVLAGTFAGGNAGGTLTISLNADATAARVDSLYKSLSIANLSDTPTPGTRQLEVVLTDGDGGTSNTAGASVVLTAINDLPSLDLDADDSSGTGSADFDTSWTEGLGSVLVADSDATLSDADNAQLTSLTVTITNLLDASAESLSVDLTGTSIVASYDLGTGVLSLSGPDTVEHYQQVLRTVSYNNASDNPNSTDRLIEFVANDGTDPSLVATTTLEIIPTNDAPVANDNTAAVNEGASVLIDVAGNDTDAEGTLDLASIVITTAPSYGTLVDNGDGTLTYSHDGSETLADSFFYEIKDPEGLTSNLARVNITVSPQNDPATFGNNALTLDEGGRVVLSSGDLSATDSDSVDADLIFTITGLSGGFFEANGNPGTPITAFTQSQITSGEISFVHDGGETAPTYSVAVSDGSLTTAPNTATITFTNVNDAAELDLDADDSTSAGTGFDATFSAAGGPVLVVDTDASLFDADSDLVALTITLTNLIDPGAEFLAADTTGTTISASYDSGTGILTLSGSASAGDYQQVLRTVTYDNTEALPDETTRTIAFVADDGLDLSNVAETDLAISIPDQAPIAADNSASLAEGGIVVIDLAGNDSDYEGQLDLSSIQIVSLPANGTLQIRADGTVRYTHDGSETALDSFSYTIRDQGGQISNTATVSITVTPENDAPVSSDDGYSMNEDLALSVDASSGVISNDNDAEGDTLTTHLISGPSDAASFVLNADGSFSYTPNADFYGTDSFSYRVTDGAETSGLSVVTLTVFPENDAPVLEVNERGSMTIGSPASISSDDLQALDVDNAAADLVFTLTAAPSSGHLELTTDPGVAIMSFTQADIDGGYLLYALDTEGATSDSFAFDVSDGSGGIMGAASYSLDIYEVPTIIPIDPTDPTDPEPDPDPSPPTTDPTDPDPDPDPTPEPDPGDPSDPTDPEDGPETDPNPTPPEILVETRLEFRQFDQTSETTDPDLDYTSPFIGERAVTTTASPLALKSMEASKFSPIALENLVFDALELGDDDSVREDSSSADTLDIFVEQTERVVMAAGLGLVAALLRTGSLLALTASSVPLWKGLDPVAALLITDKRRDKLSDEAEFAERIEDETNDVGRILDDESDASKIR